MFIAKGRGLKTHVVGMGRVQGGRWVKEMLLPSPPVNGHGERCATPYLQSTLISTMDWRWSFDAASGLGAKLAEVL